MAQGLRSKESMVEAAQTAADVHECLGSEPRIVVLWNEAVEQYRPGTDAWRMFGLEFAHLFIIIDPLSPGLYRIRIYSGDAVIFPPSSLRHGTFCDAKLYNPTSLRENMHRFLMDSSCSGLDPAAVEAASSTHRILGPAIHGMVVRRLYQIPPCAVGRGF